VDTIRNQLPIDQIAVQSIQDGVVLFPLVSSHTDTRGATAAEVHQLMQSVSGQFDLIVVDGPTGAMPRIHQFAALVDTAIIARDASRTNDETVNELASRLRGSGVQGVGIVENFS
jgi:Mrp family chromosome partitioning ATPase